tara:strand:- start:1232 stop:4651 length:3420 start_codon:yes stop_codon:yes gene_type:complete
MGIIQIETPDGIKQVEIEGGAPTEDEQSLIEETFFQSREAPSTRDIVVSAFEKAQSDDSGPDEPAFTPTHAEVEISGYDRYIIGQAENVQTSRGNERENALTRLYGPGSWGKAPDGEFYLDLDKISPEIKQQKNFPDSGTMLVNKPGGGFLGLFNAPDLSEFFGTYRGEILGGTAAALATTGLGLFPASILIGAGAGLGKGADELVELAEGTQLQSGDDILGEMATAAAWNAGGNFVIGGLLKLAGRALKGSGNPDAQVISDLIDTGLSEGQARAVAVQMQRTETRKIIAAGGRPTITDTTGKAILGRMQGIHEAIFPNRVAARANRKLIDDLVGEHKRGNISDAELTRGLDENAKNLTDMLRNAMKDPDAAVKLANQQLHDVIEAEMGLLKTLYTTGDETSKAFQDEMSRAVRLWQRNNGTLYDHASEALGEARLFDASGLKSVAENMTRPGGLAEQMGLKNDPIFQYIAKKTDGYTLSELRSLRTLVNNSRSSGLVGNAQDFQLKALSEKLDEMFDSANMLIQERISLEVGSTYRAAGITPPPGSSPTTRLPKNLAKELKDRRDRFAKGFELYKDAQAHYKDGAEIFKTGAVNMLDRNLKDGFAPDLSSVVELVIRNNKPELLKNYLNAVTPEGNTIGLIQKVPEPQWRAMAQAAENGNIVEIERLLQKNFIQLSGKTGTADLKKLGLSFRPPKFLETMPASDPYRNRILKDLSETFSLHADDAAAVAAPAVRRNANRDMLANTWMKTAREGADDLGVFDPVKFRRLFDDLGKEVQEELFGKARSKELNKVLSDFSLVANDARLGGVRFSNVESDTINNSTMRNIVSNLQAEVAVAQEQSTNALFRAVKSGNIVDAESLVQAAVKDPKLLDDLIAAVPEASLQQPGGLRDAAMARIMRQAFPDGITEAAVVSGAWQDAMRGAITNMNQRGSLGKILGQETVNDLLKITKVNVSNAAIKGKGGIVSAAYAAGIAMRVLAEPVSGLLSVAGVYASGRILRSRRFLNLMTRPNIKASDYKAGVKALTDDIISKAKADGANISREQASSMAKEQLGGLSSLRLRLKEIAAAEARLFSSTKASEATGPEQRQAVGQLLSGAARAAAPVIQDIQQQLPEVAAQAQQMNPLRQMEINKLMTGRP